MSRVSCFAPSFPDIHAYRPRRSSDLIRQRILFNLWKALGKLENLHCLFKGLLINDQVFKSSNHLMPPFIARFDPKSDNCPLPPVCCLLSFRFGIMQQEASSDKERGRQAGAEVEESFTCLAAGLLKAGAAEAG